LPPHVLFGVICLNCGLNIMSGNIEAE
jgi:hypothetical protein